MTNGKLMLIITRPNNTSQASLKQQLKSTLEVLFQYNKTSAVRQRHTPAEPVCQLDFRVKVFFISFLHIVFEHQNVRTFPNSFSIQRRNSDGVK